MQVHFGLDSLRVGWQNAVVCIGTFDGVHIGHQRVIQTAVEEALLQGVPCVLVTFDRHPAAILAPDRCPKAVGSLPTNLREFERLGVSAAIVLAFTYELSQTPAESFFEETLLACLRASQIVVGHDFAFGHGRQGTPEWLCDRIKTKIVPAVTLGGLRVSSAAIRSAIHEGRVEDAARWLGRPFELGGIVVKGERLGSELGFPTVNIAPTFDQAVPGDGVYACACATPFGGFKAAGSVGDRSTVSGTLRTIEAHLLDYPGDGLYGRSLSLKFLRRLRVQVKFDSLEELKAQMARDVENVRQQI